jgi:hypothetical protein
MEVLSDDGFLEERNRLGVVTLGFPVMVLMVIVRGVVG